MNDNVLYHSFNDAVYAAYLQPRLSTVVFILCTAPARSPRNLKSSSVACTVRSSDAIKELIWSRRSSPRGLAAPRLQYASTHDEILLIVPGLLSPDSPGYPGFKQLDRKPGKCCLFSYNLKTSLQRIRLTKIPIQLIFALYLPLASDAFIDQHNCFQKVCNISGCDTPLKGSYLRQETFSCRKDRAE
jgi:hypothetical protein